MKICIDGNDGTGKTTIISLLKERYPNVIFMDRGLPSAMTVNKDFEKADHYFILTCPVSVSLERLKNANRDMTEYWHLPETLNYFNDKFKELALQNNWIIVESTSSVDSVLNIICEKINFLLGV